MPHRATPVTVKGIKALREPGRYCDGRGLWLRVSGPTAKHWVFQCKAVTGKVRQMGLGSFPEVSPSGSSRPRECSTQARAQRRRPDSKTRCGETACQGGGCKGPHVQTGCGSLHRCARSVVEQPRSQAAMVLHVQRHAARFARGDFPSSIVLTEGRAKNGEPIASRVGWWQHEVDEWLERRAEASRKHPLPKRDPRPRRNSGRRVGSTR